MPQSTNAPTVVGDQLKQTDKSGTVTTGGTAQTVFNAADVTHGFMLQNVSSAVMWWRSDGGTAAVGAGSFQLMPGAFYQSDLAGAPLDLLSLFCATTGAAFTCKVY